jgi:signal transduction histidine kinase
MSVYSTEPGPKPDRGNFVPIDRAYINGRAVVDREVVHIPDVLPLIDTEFPDIRRNQRKFGFRAVLVVPLMREGRAVGTIFIWRREPGLFPDDQVALLRTFADQAVIAIENVRLFKELQARNRDLTEALEQQTATGEILRVISSSPTDLAPVFDAVAKSVSRLCDAPDVVIVRSEGGCMRFAASVGPFGQTFGPDLAVPIARGSVAGRAVLERRTIQVHDLAAEPDDEFPEGKALQRRYGHRTMVAAPLLLGDTALGAIAMLRTEVRPFSDKQLALLRTFADQAVIAIQNARLFNEIQEKSHQLEIANQHKSAFLANMSHELRTPLNAVIGFSEMLAARYFGDLTAKQAEYVNDIHGSGKHLLSLINDILDLSKIEAGRMELEEGEFDLQAALDNALTLVRERAQRGGVALRLETEPALGAFVGDERKLKQVMLNLLSNAVKFTPRGGAVSVAAKRVDGAAEITFSDTGAGIAPGDQEAIFEAFRQVGTDATRKREGTGLGLALTRRFVELHGGTIRVESAPGKGSTFTVRLPIRHGE